MAFGAYGHVPARPVVQLAADLELVVGQLGTDDDLLLVRKPAAKAHLDSLAAAGLIAPNCMVGPVDYHVLPRKHPLRTSGPLQAQPWAWTPDTCALFAPLDGPQTAVPKWTQARSQVWSKAWAADWLADFNRQQAVVAAADVPVVVSNDAQLARELRRLAAVAPTAVLKAPLASSGRGAIRVQTTNHVWRRSEAQWCKRLFKADGAVLSAWRERVTDLSVQLEVGAAEPVLGVTGLNCDPLGRYLGNVVTPISLAANFWELLHQVARGVAESLAAAGFRGRAGVDAMVFRDRGGALKLQPLLEVNCRTTMGHIALALRRRIAPGSVAELRLIGPRALGRETPSAHWSRVGAGAVDRQEGQIVAGVVALNDPAAARSHLALLKVDRARP